MNAWSDVITHAALQPWFVMAPALLLAATRWFGFLLWLPALGGAGFSLRMRFALSILLAIVVLPAVSDIDFHLIQASIAGAAQMLISMAGEFAIGSVLGLGVRVLFAALQLAGELIDQQAGLAMQHVLNPMSESESGPSSVALVWLGMALFFTAAPVSGDLALVDVMLQQFVALPVGTSAELAINTRLPIVLLQQAASLAFQVAGPVLGAMSLISLATAWLGRAAPRLQVGPLVAPVRIAVSLALLTAALPQLSGVLTHALDAALRSVPLSR